MSGTGDQDKLRREAIAHCLHLWPLIRGQQDPAVLDEVNDYLRQLAELDRLMHDVVMRMIERAAGIRWDVFR